MLARLNSGRPPCNWHAVPRAGDGLAYAGRLLRPRRTVAGHGQADPPTAAGWIVAITPAGRRWRAASCRRRAQTRGAVAAGADPQERAALYASLKKLQAALDDTAPQPASHATEQPARQLAARLFEVLRGQPHAHGGEILDVLPRSVRSRRLAMR